MAFKIILELHNEQNSNLAWLFRYYYCVDGIYPDFLAFIMHDRVVSPSLLRRDIPHDECKLFEQPRSPTTAGSR